MSATITDEQFAARELVRSWAVRLRRDRGCARCGARRAGRVACRLPGRDQLGIFGVALPEEHGGAGGTADDLCAMVDEAAAAMVPGPIATTALATLVITKSHADLLEALASGERTAGVALSADLRYGDGRVSGTAEYVLGADPHGVLLLPAGDKWLLVDATADGVTVEPLKATDFSRPLARVRARLRTRRGAAGVVRSGSRTSPRLCWPPRPPDWPAGRCRPPPSTRRCASSSASRSAASRPSSTCAPRCCCAPSRSRWPPRTPPVAVAQSR